MRKKYSRKDGSTGSVSTGQDESKRISKKINYTALKAAVFDDDGNQTLKTLIKYLYITNFIITIVGNFLNPDSTDAKNVNLSNSIIAPTTTKPPKPKTSKKAATKSTYVVEDIDDYEEDDDEEEEEDGNVDTSRNFNNEDHIEYFDDHEDNDYDDDYDD